MHAVRTITALLAFTLLSGCQGQGQGSNFHWPWEKDVPVTRQAPPSTAAPAPPQDQPIIRANAEPPAPPAEQEQPAPGVRVEPRVPPPAPAQPSPAGAESSHSPRAAASAPKVSAVQAIQVNGEVITLEDVLRGASYDLGKIGGGSEAAFRYEAVTVLRNEIIRLVRRTLILAEAMGRLDDDQKKQIDNHVKERLAQMVAEAGGSRTKLEEDMQREGESLDKEMEDYKHDVTVQSYLREKFTPAISVNRRMLWAYYLEHKAEFTTPRMIQVRIIAAPVRTFVREGVAAPTEADLKAAREPARLYIESALASVRAGEDFGAVAKRLSRGSKAEEGGLWPPMPEGSFKDAKLEQRAFAMSQGQVGGPIETDDTYYAVKVVSSQPGKVTPFDEAQARIDDTLRRQQFEKLSQDYQEQLFKRATVNQSDDFLRIAVDKAVEKYYRKQPATAATH